MKTAAASLAAAVLALSVLSHPRAAEVQPFGYLHGPDAWIVSPGYYGFSGYPWAPPPFAGSPPTPTRGCYLTRARLKNAWRRVEVCV